MSSPIAISAIPSTATAVMDKTTTVYSMTFTKYAISGLRVKTVFHISEMMPKTTTKLEN